MEGVLTTLTLTLLDVSVDYKSGVGHFTLRYIAEISRHEFFILNHFVVQMQNFRVSILKLSAEYILSLSF